MPSFKQQLLFWVILGALSTYFAEAISGSLFGSGIVWIILVTFPLYALHTVVLATIVYRWGRPVWRVLFVAGALFGMYEAYITKVLWTGVEPGGPFYSLGGVAIFDLIILVFFWHVLFSFIFPLIIGERVFTSSKTISFWNHTGWGWLILAVILGMNQGVSIQSPSSALSAGLVSLGLFSVLFLLSKNLKNTA